ncbi:hypothetical protein [Nocardia paucivorans]|uniref:hypothetical protein n=1 Tax=Nocardia paucivorans TaxID=114259 RepID=UPI0005947E8A|nr:hypothetical protein [Nocardia paucivorans]
MPRFTAARPGLYRWVGEQLERRYAAPDPRGVLAAESGLPIAELPRPVPVELRRYRDGLPVRVPAWWLDGHDARTAGFIGVVPRDRAVRSMAYLIGPDDKVTGADNR